MDDAALLRSYADTGSESAFAEFVRRHLPLVHGVALRRVGGDTHLAEDVAQMVFTAVARDASRLARHPSVDGWLFTTTRFLAAKAVRGERRRRERERVAVLAAGADAAPGLADEDCADARLGPVLDDVMEELRELDRQMLLMRFHRGLRLAEIAAAINSSENAVQKRIDRALQRLNAMLSRRGITSTAAAVAVALEQHATAAVPAGLAGSCTTAGLASGASGVGGAVTSSWLTGAQLKFVATTMLVGAGAAAALWYQRENARLRDELAAATAAAPTAQTSPLPPVVVARPAVPASTAAVTPVRPPAAMPGMSAQPASPAPPGPASSRPSMPENVEMVPLQIEYPRPLFAGTPRPILVANLEPVARGELSGLLVPAGARLLSRGMPVSSSDRLPVIGDLSYVTDGDKSGTDGTYVELGPNLQWVQIDLGALTWIDAIVVWHFHAQSRVYHDVIVQISADRDFRSGVITVYNNDHDNSSRLGRGNDFAYIETFRGRIFDGRQTRGRYVRLYSNGNTSDELNHYVEVEVYGRP